MSYIGHCDKEYEGLADASGPRKKVAWAWRDARQKGSNDLC